jgi:hypothetical protein
MRLPIQYALTHPPRRPAPMKRLDLAGIGSYRSSGERGALPGATRGVEAGRRAALSGRARASDEQR